MIWKPDTDVELQRWITEQENRQEQAQHRQPYTGVERRKWPRVEVVEQDDAIDCGSR